MMTFRITRIDASEITSSARVVGSDTMDRSVSVDVSPRDYAAFRTENFSVGEWVSYDAAARSFQRALKGVEPSPETTPKE